MSGDPVIPGTGPDVLPARAPRSRASWLVVGAAVLAVVAGAAALRGDPAVPGSPSVQAVAPGPSTLAANPAPLGSTTRGPGQVVPSDAAGVLPFADLGPDRGQAQLALDARARWLRTDRSPLAALPVTELSYGLGDVTTGTDGRTATADATLSYRLRGEPATVLVPVRVTLARAGERWRVVDEEPTGRPLPWQVGSVRAVTGQRTTVVGVGDVPGGRATLAWWARTGDEVTRQVRAAVPGWSPQLTVVVPPDAGALARLTGRDAASVTGLAGLALAEPVATDSPPVIRVYLNTSLLADASALAREIVLRHETTHVALEAPATASTPTWLEEGAAEYLGYQGSGVPLEVAARDLLARVAAGRVPQAPPGADDFAGPRAQVAYQSAHVLVAAMVDRVGVAGMLRVYRLTARDGDVAAPWRQVSGTGWPRLLVRWQHDLRTLAAAD